MYYSGKQSIFLSFIKLFYNIDKEFDNDKEYYINLFIQLLLNIEIDTAYNIETCTSSELLYVFCELFNINIIVIDQTNIEDTKLYYYTENNIYLDNSKIQIRKTFVLKYNDNIYSNL